ncbi:MAG: hypothetical protein E7106_04475 [Prevotella sp.]|nr:hypothetical protein [Prevotella sp.]
MKRLLSVLLVMIAVLLPTKSWAADGVSEPYAVLSENNTVLTFYYDDQKAARNGMSVGPFTNEAARGWNDYMQSITTVTFDDTFANCTSITSTENL